MGHVWLHSWWFQSTCTSELETHCDGLSGGVGLLFVCASKHCFDWQSWHRGRSVTGACLRSGQAHHRTGVLQLSFRVSVDRAPGNVKGIFTAAGGNVSGVVFGITWHKHVHLCTAFAARWGVAFAHHICCGLGAFARTPRQLWNPRSRAKRSAALLTPSGLVGWPCCT